MVNRERLALTAMQLTVTDVVVFEHCFGAIWQVWPETLWMRLLLTFLLAILAASAFFIWLHVWIALRSTILRFRLLFLQGRGELEDNPDV
jgi:hypothetical protein